MLDQFSVLEVSLAVFAAIQTALYLRECAGHNRTRAKLHTCQLRFDIIDARSKYPKAAEKRFFQGALTMPDLETAESEHFRKYIANRRDMPQVHEQFVRQHNKVHKLNTDSTPVARTHPFHVMCIESGCTEPAEFSTGRYGGTGGPNYCIKHIDAAIERANRNKPEPL